MFAPPSPDTFRPTMNARQHADDAGESRRRWRWLRAAGTFARGATCALLLASAPASAADSLEDGWRAYEEGDFGTALRVFQHLADEGDATAQFRLARLYETGRGVDADPAEALHWYRRAADRNHRTAQFVLGLKYQQGDGVGIDMAEAARWYELSARQGYPGAQLNLGALHATGEGVPRDPVRALAWWILAAKGGNTLAIRNRRELSDRLSPAEVDAAAALAETLVPE